MTDEVNGGLTRLKTKEYLDEHGCTFGNINRERIGDLEERYRSIDVKLWGLVVVVAGKLIYDILMQTPVVKAVGS